MRNLKLIIKREYLARVKNKALVVMTFLSPLILVGMIVLIAYLVNLNSNEQRVVAINDESGQFTGDFNDSEDVRFIDLSGIDLEAAKTIVKEQEYFGLLYIPTFQNNTVPNIQFF